jgi:hypothetical protein
MLEKKSSTQTARVRESHEKLLEAAFAHKYARKNPKGTRWSGAISACQAVAQFIHGSSWDPRLATVLMEIREGFRDLERGIVPPILSTSREPL